MEETKRNLIFDLHSQEMKMNVAQVKLLNKYEFKKSCYENQPKAPEELYIKSEREKEISNYVNVLRENLTAEEFAMLWLRNVEIMTLESIANVYSTNRMNICRKLKRINQKCYKMLEKERILIEGTLLPN